MNQQIQSVFPKALFIILCLFLYLPLINEKFHYPFYNELRIGVGTLIVALGLFHIYTWNKITFKGYYSSDLHPFSHKYERQIEMDIDTEFIRERIFEVCENQALTLKDKKQNTNAFLFRKKGKFLGLGENVYFEINSSKIRVLHVSIGAVVTKERTKCWLI